MKSIYLPIMLTAVVFTGCSTYKNSQTPDDVYYSPGSDREAYAASNSNSDYYTTPDDQYIRMRVQDPDRWSYFDDYNYDYYGGYTPYGYSPYYGGAFGYGFTPWIGFGYWSPVSFWNSYYTWNGLYNPYYGGIVVVNPKVGASTYTHLRTFNPASYTNNVYNRSNARSGSSYAPYSYSQTIRHSYTNGNGYSRPMYNRPMYNNNGNNYSQPVRTYSPSSFRSSSFGGGGGGGAVRSGGASRPGR